MSEDNPDFVPTRASLLKQSNDNFETVNFNSYNSEKKVKKCPQLNINNNNKAESFNIKKAKQEIIKFGTSGFKSKKKEAAKIQLAVKLGAKPPKNKYINYKLLQQKRAKEKQKEKKRLEFQQLGKNNIGKANAKGKSFDRKRRKDKSGILSVYGKVTPTNVNHF